MYLYDRVRVAHRWQRRRRRHKGSGPAAAVARLCRSMLQRYLRRPASE